tara:strand:- start:49 stop:828 length:780 start_codon:yes stop_codon:yes gene_type:complete
MPRIPHDDYKQMNEVLLPRAKSKQKEYEEFLKKLDFPDKRSSSIVEAHKAAKVIKEHRKHGWDLVDLVNKQSGFFFKSENDTHHKNRSLEKFLGGRGDGLPEPDAPWGEIKLAQIMAPNKRDEFDRHKLEQIITIGAFKRDEIQPKFIESTIYKKLRVMLAITYLQESKQLGRKFLDAFVFKITDHDWMWRIKQDYDHYAQEYLLALAEYKAGIRERRPSGIMKSDTKGSRCPNGTLGIRSDSIIFTRTFFKEVCEYYV